MSARPTWSYVQARLQARHGERLSEAGWRLLEAARSLDRFIDRSRATSLRRFTERLNAGMSSHAIERVLRTAWRDYVAEVAVWSGPDWRLAIEWSSLLPDLPTIDALLRGEAPYWAQQDEVLMVFLEHEQVASPKELQLAALLPPPAREKGLIRRWYTHWCSLWPQGAAERRALTSLADIIKAHGARLDGAEPEDASASYRRDLAQKITRMFRRNGGTPIAVFYHLALVALDLERLRGDLVRRALFAPAREAA
jgi:hypothetical protein